VARCPVPAARRPGDPAPYYSFQPGEKPARVHQDAWRCPIGTPESTSLADGPVALPNASPLCQIESGARRLPRTMHRRQSRTRRQDVDANAVGVGESIGTNIPCVCAASECLEGRNAILRSPNFGFVWLETRFARWPVPTVANTIGMTDVALAGFPR